MQLLKTAANMASCGWGSKSGGGISIGPSAVAPGRLLPSQPLQGHVPLRRAPAPAVRGCAHVGRTGRLRVHLAVWREDKASSLGWRRLRGCNAFSAPGLGGARRKRASPTSECA